MCQRTTMAERLPPTPTSPVRKVDPIVRALHTVIHGLVVHFATIWSIPNFDAAESSKSENPSYPPGALVTILLLHEYWVFLQHSNVFANPFCQHLDRQYGIALLKSNEHWAIAGTLSAYWCRETLGMFFCLPFLQHDVGDSDAILYRGFSITQYLILYSLIYHTIKSRGVREDTLRRYSTKFGIMRLVIDKFYLHSSSEIYISLLRVFLQGFDTFIHFRIICDLVLLFNDGASLGWFLYTMHITFFVWVIHAALNQLLRCSTASVMVQSWHALSMKMSPRSESNDNQQQDIKLDWKTTEHLGFEPKDCGSVSEGESTTSNNSSFTDNYSHETVETISCDDEDFLVRYLLRPGRVPDELKGRQGRASAGVDSVIRIETAVAILTSFFMFGLSETPFRFLSLGYKNGERIKACVGDASFASSWNFQRIIHLMSLAWILWGLLYGIWALMLKHRDPMQTNPLNLQTNLNTSAGKYRTRSIIYAIDVIVVIGIAHFSPIENKSKTLMVAIVLMMISYFRATQTNAPRFFRRATTVLEFIAKMQALRHFIEASYDSADFAAVSSAVSTIWFLFVVSNPNPTPCEANPKYKCISDGNDKISFGKDNGVADACFLGHPAELSDCWALWLLPYSLEERWRPPFWAWPLWPLHYVVGWYVCNYRQKLFGDGASFFCSDDVYYGSKRVQNWVATHFGRHFVTHPRSVSNNIIAAARHAEKTGVKVLCLGALNKAESINGGGVGVVKALGLNRKLSIIHGNHLTAAAVVETIYQCFGDRKVRFFLTGASSKVGWAVAQALRDRHGYDILCHSTDAKRREYFRTQGFEAARTLGDGSSHNYWIVGKYDIEVAHIIPHGATAVVFSVPHPLQCRPDVRVIEAGTLHMDMSRLDRPRVFTNKLRAHEIFACHAASIVAAYRIEIDGKRIDEVGPVDPHTMDGWLDDAKKLGFRVPHYDPVEDDEHDKVSKGDKPPVVIIGAGPSGLSIAAQLNMIGIPNIILEAQNNPECFGSWDHHFTGLEVTSQKKWCNLPGYSMSNKDFPNETVTAEEYQSYLKRYALRFAVKIRRGAKVQSIEKGDELNPWIVKFESSNSGNRDFSEIVASQVVVATGKHRSPMKNTSDDLVSKLHASKIPFVHSTEIRDECSWRDTIKAARNGRLCVVGFGNSAADLATIILQHCPSDTAEPKIHIAARSIPPVFPRKKGMLRVDTIGYLIRWIPGFLQDLMVHLLWNVIPSSRQCNSAFPPHLKRWKKIRGRVPVIDKHGAIASGFMSGRLVGHGPIENISEEREVQFQDEPASPVLHCDLAMAKTKIEFVILATGYEEDCIVGREDRINGLYKCGFGKDYFLPLKSIGDEAMLIAREISSSF